VSAPRQAAPPRAGSGPRQPAGARRARGAVAGPARAGGEATPHARHARPAEPAAPALATAPPLEPPGQRSAWQQLLDELNRLLRDPTLTRALKAFAAKAIGVARQLPAATAAAARALARALARIRLPRRLLLGLLALLLPLALLALLLSSDDERRAAQAPTPPAAPGAPADAAGAAFTLPAVGMPQLLAAPDDVRPVRVALVVDRTYDRPALRRELGALGGWLTDNHAPGTRVSVIDAATGRASRPLDAAHLAEGARPTRQRASTAAAVRSELARPGGRHVLVTLGGAPTPQGAPRALRIATRPGPSTGSAAALAQRRRSRVTIDERRPNAFAAEVARAVMAVSGERERR